MPGAGQRLVRWGGIVGFLLNCGLATLTFLSSSALQNSETSNAVSPQRSDSPRPGSNWAADFPARVDQVTAALSQLTVALPPPTATAQGAGTVRWFHRRYEITVPKPQTPTELTRLLDPIRAAATGVTLNVAEEADGAKVQIGIDGLLTHTIALHWLGRRPRAAIIIDDLGSDLLNARALAAIDAPITFAVKPFQPFSNEVAELAALFNREVLLQLEIGGHGNDGSPSLPADGDRSRLSRWLEQHLASVPHAAGIAARLEPSLGGDQQRTQWVLQDCLKNSLFVVDTDNTSRNVLCEAAASLALDCVKSDVLLDDTDDERIARNQLRAVVEMTRTQSDTVAVGHATSGTLAALRAVAPAFAAAGVDLVAASTIAGDRSLSRR